MTPQPKPAAKPPVPAKPKWYELDRLQPYRDVVLFLGFASIVAGCCLVYIPAGLIVAGAGFIWAAIQLAKVNQ